MTKLTEAEQQLRDNLADILIGAGWSATNGAAFHDLGEAIPAIVRELEINRKAQAAQDTELGYATRLATTLAKKFYPEVPQWKALDDLYGVISQIDNITAGLCREQETEASAQHIARGDLSDIENPTAHAYPDAPAQPHDEERS